MPEITKESSPEMKSIILFIAISLLSSSCSLLWKSKNKKRNSSSNYAINLNKPWEKIRSNQDVDFAFYHKESKELVYSLSYCHLFQNESIEDILNKSLFGVRTTKHLSKNKTEYFQRESIERTSLVDVDGVNRYIHQIALRKNHCYYEIQIISDRKDVNKIKNMIIENTKIN